MFVRKKKNKSGVISVQVIDKSSGKYRVIKTIGSSPHTFEVESLMSKAKEWINQECGLQEIDFTNYLEHTKLVLEGIEHITVCGPDLLLGKIFDEIGFNAVKEPLFRQLVIARLCYPVSKLKTTDYLSKYQFLNVDVQKVYRYLDKLYKEQKELVQQISYVHTLKILEGELNVVFYDVTTIYFEIESEDELRKTGFSKEGRHQNPQIVLGLLVSKGGYPLAYEIFKGNQFEGHTMLPVLERFRKRYQIAKMVIIADAGLLSKENISLLDEGGYEYILGARIKTMNASVQEQIHGLKLQNGQSVAIKLQEGRHLIVSHSQSRATKDAHNRARGIVKIEKQIKSGKLTKSHINNRGYNKFVQMEGELKIKIDVQKVEQDKKWDGLKGYITNTTLPKEEVMENYKELWQIEKAFRIAKTDLEIRPIYHRVERRIEAHICIAFVAYKLYKELDRQLKLKNSPLSPEKAIEIAKTIYSVKVVHPITKQAISKKIILTEDQKNLAKMFGF